LACDPAGRFIVAGLASGTIELRDAQTGALIESRPIGHGAISALTVTVDGRTVAGCEDGTIVCLTFAKARR
jgi:WD40 repeat protein